MEINNLDPNISNALLAWYENGHRNLPWREDPTPYHVWVSEIMLQQTRVEAVKEYYNRFISELPTIHDLAVCDDDRLQKLWQGLGYYSRAKNLKKAANLLDSNYHSVIPSDFETLLTLPGIGRYTAGAIASFAYNQPVPAIDGNVLRVVTRLLNSDLNISDIRVKRAFEGPVTDIIPKNNAKTFNQAIMELGATVCGPNAEPKCDSCPISKYCKSHLVGDPSQLPVKNAKKDKKSENFTILIIHAGPYTLLHKRDNHGLLASLYEFFTLNGHISLEGVEKSMSEFGFEIESIESLAPAKHIFTHIVWNMIGYEISIHWNSFEKPSLPSSLASNNFLFANKEEIESKYSIPSAFQAFNPIK